VSTRTQSGSVSPSYFEEKYRGDIDPWRFRTSPYEREKYDATVHALTKPRYRNGLEVGCAIGVLSALLAPRCEQLIAMDSSPTAIAEATRQNRPNVRFERDVLPDEFPDGVYELIVLSEVLYYFADNDLMNLAQRCLDALAARGEMILCHWLGETDYPLTGQQAGDLFAKAVSRRRPTRLILHEGVYRLERLTFAN
jgi:SAM-dependent methyltransferase